MFAKRFVMMPCVEHKPLNCTRVLNVVTSFEDFECQLTHYQVRLMKTWRKSIESCMRTADMQLMISLVF